MSVGGLMAVQMLPLTKRIQSSANQTKVCLAIRQPRLPQSTRTKQLESSQSSLHRPLLAQRIHAHKFCPPL